MEKKISVFVRENFSSCTWSFTHHIIIIFLLQFVGSIFMQKVTVGGLTILRSKDRYESWAIIVFLLSAFVG